MSSYPLLNVFLTMLWFFLWIMWIFLLVWIVIDIFRSRGLSGWGKAGWLAFVMILPFLGVFVYLIVHGSDMADRRGGAQPADGDYAAHGNGPAGRKGADELAKLADLRDRGVLTEAEFQQGKARILS